MNNQSKKLFVFDLDNTLYDEFSFLIGKLSLFLKSYDLEKSIVISVLSQFKESFEQKKLENIIQDINSSLNLKLSVELYKDFLRSDQYIVEIGYFPGVVEKLKSIKKYNGRIRVLTNGNVPQQKQKIASLSRFFDLQNVTVYAEEIKPKPSPLALNFILMQERVTPQECLFIGDSISDRDCALNSKVDFLQSKVFFDFS